MDYSIETKVVKTRKDHVCWGCYEKIQKGEKAVSQTNVNDSGIYKVYLHIHCDKMCQRIVADMVEKKHLCVDDCHIESGFMRELYEYGIGAEDAR